MINDEDGTFIKNGTTSRRMLADSNTLDTNPNSITVVPAYSYLQNCGCLVPSDTQMWPSVLFCPSSVKVRKISFRITT